jgi:two-component sensor histidine kinase
LVSLSVQGRIDPDGDLVSVNPDKTISDNALADTLPQGGWAVNIKALLILFVMMIVLPAWGFASYVAIQYARTERQAIEASGRTISRAIASAMEYRLKSIEAGMTALSLSPQLNEHNFSAFYAEAKAFSVSQRVAVGLVSADGKQILNTSASNGATLPPVIAEAKTATAIQTGKIQYSALFRGNVTDAWLMSVAMPLVTDQASSYALVVGTPTVVTWGELLNNVDLPPGWILSIADEANIIAARRPFTEAFIGQPIHADALNAIATSRDGWGTATSKDGKPVYLAFQHLNAAPWTVLVGIPAEAIDGAFWQTLSPVLAGGLAVLIITVLLAWLIGMRFSSHLGSVAAAASAFRVGKNLLDKVQPSRISELAELRTMMESASAERSRNEDRLRVLLADKDMLMQEVHHRVKNSLQLVRGILSLQARTATNDEARTALNDAATRILTVADVHQHLYQGHSTTEVNVRQYLEDLGRDLNHSLLERDADRQITVRSSNAIWLSEKIVALGLITTELVTNAIKYGKGNVGLEFEVKPDGHARLVVQDEGSGFPAGFKIGQAGGLGSKLIGSLVREGEGSVRIDRSQPGGCVVVSLTPDWRQS